MKKYISLLLVSGLLFTAVSCTEKAADSNTAKTKYTIYYSCSETMDEEALSILEQATAAAEKKNMKFEPSSDLDFSNIRFSEYENEEVEKNKQFLIDEKTVSFELIGSYKTPLSACETVSLQKYGYLNRYSADNRMVETLEDTGEICFIGCTDDAILQGAGDCTEEDIRELADALLTSLFGETAVADCQIFVFPRGTDNRIAILYTNYLHGYKTSDTVQVTYNTKGELISLTAHTFGIFSLLEEEITEEKIDAAKVALLSAVSDSYDVAEEDLELEIDSEGTVYLVAYVADSSTEETSGLEKLYINVN